MRMNMSSFALGCEKPTSRPSSGRPSIIRFGKANETDMPKGDVFQRHREVSLQAAEQAKEKYDRKLLQAVKSNQSVEVRQNLQAGSDSNARDRLFYTALHRAVDQGNADMVEMLLKEGADPNAKAPNFQVTAVHHNPASEEAQHIAQLGGDIATMSSIVQDTPLDRAFHHRKLSVIPALILGGAEYPQNQQPKLEQALKVVFNTQNLSDRLTQAIEELDTRTTKVLLKVGVRQEKLSFLYGDVFQKAIDSAKASGSETQAQRKQRLRQHHQSLQMLRILEPFLTNHSYLAHIVAQNKDTLVRQHSSML